MIINLNQVAFEMQPEVAGIVFEILRQGSSWVVIVIGSLLAVLPEFCYLSFKNVYFPDLPQKLRNFFQKASK